jgi:hypothetical protein
MNDFRSESHVAIYKLIDGMCVCAIKSDQIIDGRFAKKITEERRVLIGEESWPTLVVIPRRHLLVENDALQFFGSAEGLSGTVAQAVVIQSSLRKVLSNFNFMFKSQKVPFRVFTSRSEAKLWLFDYILDKEELEFFD